MTINKDGSGSPFSGAARKKYAALLLQYSENDTSPTRTSYWKLGNTFDTMIDYLDIIDESGADKLAAIVVEQYVLALDRLGGYDNAWFDDFGWWTVATERAQGKAFFNDAAKAALSKITDGCWIRFTGNAPYVWERRASNSFMDCHPAYDGGVWNEYWTGTPPQYHGPNDGDPDKPTLHGIQNTVTNALYLMAAHRLGHTDPAARQAALKALEFVLKWFEDKEHPLWWQVGPSAALVRERVGHFARRAPPVPPAPGFQNDWAWTGDQGLILGDLSDAMLHIAPGSREPLLHRATQIIAGVCEHLTKKRVVQPYNNIDSVPDGDTGDYDTGTGVFWRNALYVWRTNSELHNVMKGPNFQAILRASADAAVNAPTEGASFVDLSNDTAVLVAASVMLPR